MSNSGVNDTCFSAYNRLMTMRIAPLTALTLLVAGCTAPNAIRSIPTTPPDLTLWYDAPAAYEDKRPGMNRALPIGNGPQGSLVYGGVAEDRLILNHDSLWTGDTNASGDYEKMGEYRCAGELRVDFSGQAKATNYRRDLDLSEAVAHVSYAIGPVTFQRQYFASAVDRVQVARYTASAPGAYTGSVSLRDLHNATITASGNNLVAAGSLSNGLSYSTQIRLVAEGGSVTAAEGRIAFTGCSALTVLYSVGTDYVMDRTKGWKGEAPGPRLTKDLDAAAGKTLDRLVEAHRNEYRGWFDRVHLDLGTPTAEQRALPTDQRKALAIAKADDASFAALVFQYGRYLLISCSRPGSLPANLQGLWNDRNNPAWHSDYHTNINVQMNYWPAEVANLSECHLPLFDLIESQIPDWRIATAASPEFRLDGKPSQGWTVRTSHNIHGGMGWKWDNTSNAWYGLHFWEHYAFTRDEAFLRTRAYPLLKEVAEFWDARLKALPDGRLVIPNGWSPEHGPTEDGVSYSQQIVYDLFTNYVQAADTLKLDKPYRDRIAGLRDRLVGPNIGNWGQLHEWMHELNVPTYDAAKDFGKDRVKTVETLRKAREGTAAAYVWKALPAAARSRLETDANDRQALVDGINAIVNGPSLATQPAFADRVATTIAGRFQTRAATDPSMVPWVNRTLLAEAADLNGGRFYGMPYDHHRHTSHLFAVFPGRQITVQNTPDFAEAAQVSLEARGPTGDAREWSCAWRSNLYARVHNGKLAEQMVREFMKRTCLNLFGDHPPMQIDGNFGITAAVAEMLVQSHTGTIELLPALPAVWPTGHVEGLRARGGATVEVTWNNGVLTEATLTTTVDGPLAVRYGATTRTIDAKAGNRYRLDAGLAVTVPR